MIFDAGDNFVGALGQLWRLLGRLSTNRCIEGGAASALLISRHHLEVSYCRAGAGQGICNTKKRRADPSMGTAHYSNPTSPHSHSFPLVVQKLSNSNFVTLSHFHFGSKVSWILFTFHVRKYVGKERITIYHSLLHFTLDIITVDQYHTITLISTESV